MQKIHLWNWRHRIGIDIGIGGAPERVEIYLILKIRYRRNVTPTPFLPFDESRCCQNLSRVYYLRNIYKILELDAAKCRLGSFNNKTATSENETCEIGGKFFRNLFRDKCPTSTSPRVSLRKTPPLQCTDGWQNTEIIGVSRLKFEYFSNLD